MFRNFNLATVLVLLLLANVGARAETFATYNSALARPAATSPLYIEMLFYKMANQLPDFKSLAKKLPEYKDAGEFERVGVMEAKAKELQDTYSLITPQELIVVETPVKLSEYSAANHGFFIDSFTDETFFPVVSDTTKYALIPTGIMDKQWVKISDEEKVKALAEANKTQAGITALVFLQAKYADNSNPAQIKGDYYWLLSNDVKRIELYVAGASKPVWKSDELEQKDNDDKLQELLRLRQ